MNFYTNVQCVGSKMLVRGVDNRTRFKVKDDYNPTLFIPKNGNSEYKSLFGEPVGPISLGTIKDARDFVTKYSNVDNFHIYGNRNYQYCYIGDKYSEVQYDKDYIVMVNMDIEVDSQNGFPYPETATEKLLSIAMNIKSPNREHSGMFVFGWGGEFTAPDDVIYIDCRDEEDLIFKFIEFWENVDPDIITGWNVQFFDVPYLVNRITNVVGEKEAKRLSPWKRFSVRNAIIHGRENQAINLLGISILDYMEMYKKFTYTNRESYRLDHIAHIETGYRKLEYDEYSNLDQLYRNDYQKFIEYNIRDVRLVDEIDDKMKLIDMILELAYSAKVNYNDVFSQVRMWDTMIYHHLKQKNVVLPPPKPGSKDDQYVGAYVKEPISGVHKWVVSFDLDSLYPHLIMQYNISPETLVDRKDVPRDLYDSLVLGQGRNVSVYDEVIDKAFDTSLLKKYEYTVTPNVEFFDTTKQGFLSEMMETLYDERKQYKKMMLESEKKLEGVGRINTVAEGKQHFYTKYTKEIAQYKNMQLARKVQLNSAYGALGNQYFRFYDVRLATAVTKSGQLSIRWIESRVNSYLNDILGTEDFDYIIASDTDSIYVSLEGLVNKVFGEKDVDVNAVVSFLDKASQGKIVPYIGSCYEDLAEYMNAYSQKMNMTREIIADKGIWTTKKRYALNVYDSEGVRYSQPKLKMMGLETVKSSTPAICRTRMTEAIKLMMNGTQEDMYEFVSKFRSEFNSLPLEDIAFPRGVNGVDKYDDGRGMCIKGTPIHVRGSLLYNRLLNTHALTKKYPIIHNGDKIKFVYLNEPNPVTEFVISVVGKLPDEFCLDEYIDYDLQFEKAFLDPLTSMLDHMGWKPKEESTLNDFFV